MGTKASRTTTVLVVVGVLIGLAITITFSYLK